MLEIPECRTDLEKAYIMDQTGLFCILVPKMQSSTLSETELSDSKAVGEYVADIFIMHFVFYDDL